MTPEGMGALTALDSSRLGSVDSSRPLRANSGHSQTVRRTGQVDPKEAFVAKIGTPQIDVKHPLRMAALDASLGGKRAHTGRLGKDRGAGQSHRSVASAK